mmetsp:Transcript_94597/g.178041  ORF Transcript_94597/g.178041 Transcript_94597/m.178041 type:complete len:214 (+) Transcript_94597:397-1038(+)
MVCESISVQKASIGTDLTVSTLPSLDSQKTNAPFLGDSFIIGIHKPGHIQQVCPPPCGKEHGTMKIAPGRNVACTVQDRQKTVLRSDESFEACGDLASIQQWTSDLPCNSTNSVRVSTNIQNLLEPIPAVRGTHGAPNCNKHRVETPLAEPHQLIRIAFDRQAFSHVIVHVARDTEGLAEWTKTMISGDRACAIQALHKLVRCCKLHVKAEIV